MYRLIHFRSRIEDIKTDLTALSEEIRKRHIKRIALLPLGCGNGVLDWSEVLPAIRRLSGRPHRCSAPGVPPAGSPEAHPGLFSSHVDAPSANDEYGAVCPLT
jgi:hypothetical protein